MTSETETVPWFVEPSPYGFPCVYQVLEAVTRHLVAYTETKEDADALVADHNAATRYREALETITQIPKATRGTPLAFAQQLARAALKATATEEKTDG